MITAIVASHQSGAVPEFAGNTWAVLQYVLGLRRLGVRAIWADRLEPVNPLKGPHSLDYLVNTFDAMAQTFCLRDSYCIEYAGGERHFGMTEKRLREAVKEADLLINFGGHLPQGSLLNSIPRRAFIDVDPGFTQIWGHQTDIGLDRHNSFFTIGQNVPLPGFKIPTNGVDRQPILPPVDLDSWPVLADERCERFSTIADWRGSQNAIFEGEYYAGKREEFIRFLDVPLRANQRIELALTIGQHDYEDLGLLLGHNWRVREPSTYAGDPLSYREFIQRSRAEFSVAKTGYVKCCTGWVSDRTACYLASGKPVLVQSTGFEWLLPTGEGLLTFHTIEEAVAGIASINNDYISHCKAARRMAEKYFAADVVLSSLLERAGL